MSLVPFLHHAAAGHHLTFEEAHEAMTVLLEGRAGEAEIAGFLVALRMKGETASELAGFAQAMREKSVFVDAGASSDEAGGDLIDIVGTGGDEAGTFNISTVAAMIVAGAGVRVAKHGNRAISGRVGSADVLEALGVRIALTPEESVRAIREIGLGFLFAPHLHPAMQYAQPVRRALKMRTVFNLLGPLANPARAQYQLIGAPSSYTAQIMAEALSQLGTAHSYVVHGALYNNASPDSPTTQKSGLDEISTTAATSVFEVWSGRVEKHVWTPEQFGIGYARLEDLAGGDAGENAAMIRSILAGEPGARSDIAILNAAAGLMACRKAASPDEAIVMATESVGSGRAAKILERLQEEFPAE
jgi:anthranilate phosphoribosyltransferase